MSDIFKPFATVNGIDFHYACRDRTGDYFVLVRSGRNYTVRVTPGGRVTAYLDRNFHKHLK